MRFHEARRTAELCAACGRDIVVGETVYIERFTLGTLTMYGPVGIECASTELLERTQHQKPERCAVCDRGVFYRAAYRRRQRILCSQLCAGRAGAATWATGKEPAG